MSKKPTYKELEQKIKKLEKKVETFSKIDEVLAESEMKCRLLLTNLPGIVYIGFKDWSVEFTDNKVEALTGLCWWSECWKSKRGFKIDSRIDSSPKALQAFKQGTSNPYFLGKMPYRG